MIVADNCFRTGSDEIINIVFLVCCFIAVLSCMPNHLSAARLKLMQKIPLLMRSIIAEIHFLFIAIPSFTSTF